MQKYQSIISGTNGSVIRNVPVTVLKEDGSLAEIFLDREGQVPASNPLATDSRGVFYFYAANGRYSLRTSVDGITITDADAVLLNDPEEIEVGKVLMTEGERTKLAGIAEQATKNATDAALRDRSTHTGTQAISTVTGLQTALDSKVNNVAGKQLSTEDYTSG